jgi:hypothetical protein
MCKPQLRQLLATSPLGGHCGFDDSRYGNGVPVCVV